MRQLRIHPFMFVIALMAQLLLSAAEAHGQYTATWHTIDGGGGTSTGGAFSLSGTAGQPDASNALTGAGGWSVTGGFWPGAAPISDCPADITNDNAVNVNDLLAVITNWGACPLPCPPHCPADITPLTTGDCAVNVNDLLKVITSWGPCP